MHEAHGRRPAAGGRAVRVRRRYASSAGRRHFAARPRSRSGCPAPRSPGPAGACGSGPLRRSPAVALATHPGFGPPPGPTPARRRPRHRPAGSPAAPSRALHVDATARARGTRTVAVRRHRARRSGQPPGRDRAGGPDSALIEQRGCPRSRSRTAAATARGALRSSSSASRNPASSRSRQRRELSRLLAAARRSPASRRAELRPGAGRLRAPPPAPRR